MRSSACVLAILLVAACASTPAESLVWSAELARSLPRERGEVVEVGRFSRSPPEDYRRAFGAEPSDVLAVGLMTDPGDGGSRRRSFYGDITFRSDK